MTGQGWVEYRFIWYSQESGTCSQTGQVGIHPLVVWSSKSHNAPVFRIQSLIHVLQFIKLIHYQNTGMTGSVACGVYSSLFMLQRQKISSKYRFTYISFQQLQNNYYQLLYCYFEQHITRKIINLMSAGLRSNSVAGLQLIYFPIYPQSDDKTILFKRLKSYMYSNDIEVPREPILFLKDHH